MNHLGSEEVEVAIGSVLEEKVLLEILQNSQKSTCARVSFLIKLQTFPANVAKPPVNFAKPPEHLRETASDIKFIYIENVKRLVLLVVLL